MVQDIEDAEIIAEIKQVDKEVSRKEAKVKTNNDLWRDLGVPKAFRANFKKISRRGTGPADFEAVRRQAAVVV